MGIFHVYNWDYNPFTKWDASQNRNLWLFELGSFSSPIRNGFVSKKGYPKIFIHGVSSCSSFNIPFWGIHYFQTNPYPSPTVSAASKNARHSSRSCLRAMSHGGSNNQILLPQIGVSENWGDSTIGYIPFSKPHETSYIYNHITHAHYSLSVLGFLVCRKS